MSYQSLEGCHMPAVVLSRNTLSSCILGSSFPGHQHKDSQNSAYSPLLCHPTLSLPALAHHTSGNRESKILKSTSKKSSSKFTQANFKLTSRFLLATRQDNIKLSSSKPPEQTLQLTVNAICCSYTAVNTSLKVTHIHLHRLQLCPCPQYRHIQLEVAKEVFPTSPYCSGLCKEETPRTVKFQAHDPTSEAVPSF